MKRLLFLIILGSYSFAMESSLLKQPKSLKMQSYFAIFEGLKKGTYDYEKVAKVLPLDLVQIIKPHTSIHEIVDEEGNKISLFLNVHQKTPDYQYGIMDEAEFGKKENTAYCINLFTGKKEKITAEFFILKLSSGGSYCLHQQLHDKQKWKDALIKSSFILHNIAKHTAIPFDIADGSSDACFCGDEYIFFRLRSRKTAIYQIVGDDIHKKGTVNVEMHSIADNLVQINNKECIIEASVDKENYYCLLNYTIPQVLKKWVCKDYSFKIALSVYDPRRLVAFVHDEYKKIVRISSLDAPVDPKNHQLPALWLVHNQNAKVESLCFANQGNWLVTGSNNHDGQIRIWDWQKIPQQLLIVFNPNGILMSPLNDLFYNASKLFFRDGYGKFHTIMLIDDVEFFAASLACQQKVNEKKQSPKFGYAHESTQDSLFLDFK